MDNRFVGDDVDNIAVIICNYNGGMDTVKCVQKVLDNSFQNTDIFIVDNASEDDSVKLLIDSFGERITILYNKTNLGGSGGFGRGLRHAVDSENYYPYIMMIDNDAYLDSDTIQTMHDYLLSHKDVGIVGAKIMMLEDPERIMDFAKTMDWQNFSDGSKWCGQIDSEETKKDIECDYVAATAAMVTREALIQSGGMDEGNFIYYDDIDLNQRIRLAGYKVVCLGTTKAWHKSSMAHRKTDTFTKYYIDRNRYRFFAKYLPEEKLQQFAEHMLGNIFPFLYGSHYMGRNDVFTTNKYILFDFLSDTRGKARDGRVQKIVPNYEENFTKLVCGKSSIGIFTKSANVENLKRRFLQVIECVNPNCRVEKIQSLENNQYDLVVCLCEHVKDEHMNILPAVYIDRFNNIVEDWKSYLYFQNYDNAFEFFRRMYEDELINCMHEIRKG